MYYRSITFLLCIFSNLGCSFNNIKIVPDIDKHFELENVKGGFILLDNTNGLFYLSDVYQDTVKRPAAGSAALFLALVALEENVVANEREFIKPKYLVNIRGLLNNTETSVMDNFVRCIPKERLYHWADSLQYGAKSTKTTSLYQRMLSTDEQLGLIKQLYFNQLPFATRTNRIVKKSVPVIQMKQQNIAFLESAYTQDSTSHIWNMGWIEKDKDIYIFTAYGKCQQDAKTAKASMKRITIAALNKLNIISN